MRQLAIMPDAGRMKMAFPSHTVPRTGRGFTLMELLITVAVIGVLAVLIIPAAGRAMDSAKSAACVGNLRSLGAAIATYQSENQYIIPGDDAGFSNPQNITWLSALSSYCDIKSVSTCPSARNPGDDSLDNGGGNKWGSFDHAWKLGAGSWMMPQGGPDHASYTLNMWARRDFMSNSIVESERASLGSTRVDNASRIPLIMDGRWEGIWPVDSDPLPAPGALKGKNKELDINGSTWRMVDNVAMLRHGPGINICFLDGSVRNVDVNDLWTLKWNKNYEDRGTVKLH